MYARHPVLNCGGNWNNGTNAGLWYWNGNNFGVSIKPSWQIWKTRRVLLPMLGEENILVYGVVYAQYGARLLYEKYPPYRVKTAYVCGYKEQKIYSIMR